MADFGKPLPVEMLCLVKGRDFKWTVPNLDPKTKQPVPWPAGELFLELETGGEHNALQEVRLTGATDGTYKFTHRGVQTGPIDYYDATTNPHGMDGDIQDALEALSNVGAGNVIVHPAQLFPAWELDITLNTGQNEIQQIIFTGNPSGGKFKLNHGGNTTPVIAFGAAASAVQTALQALPSIGTGGCTVTTIPNGYQVEFVGTKAATDVAQITGSPWGIDFSEPGGFYSLSGGIFPNVTTSTVRPGTAQLTEQLVNTLNKTVNDLFNTFDGILGVDIDFYITSKTNIQLKVTSLRSFVESDIITFTSDVTSNTVKSAINQALGFVGLTSVITVDFWWNHVYQVEFVGALANTAQPALEADITNIVGAHKAIEVEVLAPGKARLTKWPLTIDGANASIKVESEEADKIPNRCRWQLVHLPTGEAAGGDPKQIGLVYRQPR
ncbi:hypothetical protein SEA_ACOLYTE_6 [Mycobacterium phage Acolyte]|nr:hypothetical protein SEA_ACOLYTE_6 [Mycobacterium phage Acolyte]